MGRGGGYVCVGGDDVGDRENVVVDDGWVDRCYGYGVGFEYVGWVLVVIYL